ncbi:MAG: hypothetical protein K5883_05800 [Pseudobutyrivibrio sp.]|nr:hypothetical protein [Pseudobutyrivibrio sp.]
MRVLRKISSLLLAFALIIAGSLSTNIIEASAAATMIISSASISGGSVVITASGVAASEDGMYHLIASAANQVAPAGKEVASQGAGSTKFVVPLNKGTADSVLFKKFTICGKVGGKLVPVSNSMFITNPEATASHRPKRMDYGKKGILPALEKNLADKNLVADLGIKQVNLNIPISQLNSLGGYDYSVQKYNSLGIQVNVILLADKAAGKKYISPLSYKGMGSAHSYYGFNASSETALEDLGNAAAQLASHYSNIGFGQVDNFIIGNEVNAWYKWNYMNCGSNDAFMNEYYKAFRVMYNGIKSENANANVYTCIDHEWAKPEASYYISGKEFLTKLNNLVTAEGNIDWRVAAHPNNVLLREPQVWAPSKQVTHDQSSPFVTMANLEVLTDYLSLPEMLSPSGKVRSVKLSEVGYPSNKGEELQAAAVVFAYNAAMSNSHVDGFVLLRENDHKEEIAQGLACGIGNVNDAPKMAYSFYKNASDPGVIAQANAIAGVDFSQLIIPR